MPAPPTGKAIAGNQCVNSPIQFVSEVDKSKAGWLIAGYDVRLRHWAIRYYGARAGSKSLNQCFDGDFAVRAWQLALGHSETGVLTREQAKVLVDIVDQHETNFVQAKRNEVPFDPKSGDTELLSKAIEAYYARKYDIATPLVKTLAERGNHKAQYLLGHSYRFGLGIDSDKREAMRWYGKSAQAGDPEGLSGLAICYIDGCVKKDYAQAKKLAELAASKQHPAGYYALSYLYGTRPTSDSTVTLTNDVNSLQKAIQLASYAISDDSYWGYLARTNTARYYLHLSKIQYNLIPIVYPKACDAYVNAFAGTDKLLLASDDHIKIWDLEDAYSACNWSRQKATSKIPGYWNSQFEKILRLAKATEPRMIELGLRMQSANIGASVRPRQNNSVLSDDRDRRLQETIREGYQMQNDNYQRLEQERMRQEAERQQQMQRDQEYARRLQEQQNEADRRWRQSQGGY